MTLQAPIVAILICRLVEPLAALKPGDMLPQDESPVIAMKDGKSQLAIATIGVSLMPDTVWLLVGVLANYLNPPTAMAGPPLLRNLEPMKAGEKAFTKPYLVPEGAYNPDLLQAIQESGLGIEQKSTVEV